MIKTYKLEIFNTKQAKLTANEANCNKNWEIVIEPIKLFMWLKVLSMGA
jgi:hypothetical protein